MPYRHGSLEWMRDKRGLTIGSSEAAAVFPGVSTTVSHSDLKRKLLGIPASPPSSFLLDLFQQGQDWEEIMLNEVRELTHMVVQENLVFEREECIGDVRMVASPDAVIMDMGQCPSRMVLLEIKFRVKSPTAGWPREKGGPAIYLGDTVWCQVQHQMWVTGIHACLVLAGTRTGDRRMWAVEYCEPYIRERYIPQLKHLISDPNGPSVLSGAVARQSIVHWKHGTSRSMPFESIGKLMYK